MIGHAHRHYHASMLSVEEALERILSAFYVLEPEERPLMDALGQVLAEGYPRCGFKFNTWEELKTLALHFAQGFQPGHAGLLGREILIRSINRGVPVELAGWSLASLYSHLSMRQAAALTLGMTSRPINSNWRRTWSCPMPGHCILKMR